MRSIPNLDRSYRAAAVAMNSIAQQAVPNGIGHKLLDLAQFTRKSRRVVTQLGDTEETMPLPSAPADAVAALGVNPIPTLPSSRRRRARPRARG